MPKEPGGPVNHNYDNQRLSQLLDDFRQSWGVDAESNCKILDAIDELLADLLLEDGSVALEVSSLQWYEIAKDKYDKQLVQLFDAEAGNDGEPLVPVQLVGQLSENSVVAHEPVGRSGIGWSDVRLSRANGQDSTLSISPKLPGLILEDVSVEGDYTAEGQPLVRSDKIAFLPLWHMSEPRISTVD